MTETITAAETETETETADPARTTREALQGRLAGLSPVEQITLLTDLVVAEAEIARTEQNTDEPFEDELDEESPLFEVGFNSLSAVELRNRLVEATGLSLDPMLLFDYPTPGFIAEHLQELLAADAA
ncbi:acyl carrier protein [Streptomyces sp. NRRL S-378]|uniref:acyl carrier protein n=1 Tax=Streptomyces sp. NRRL S-378 TaxID=1463904 RepID=UPI001F34CF03